MNKKIKIGISILIILIITSIQISYAIGNNKKNSFFTVNKLEISPEETLEMTFDISSLKYNKFTILLNSSISSQNIYTKDDADISIKDDPNDVSIEIDKDKMNLDKLTLYYPIPKDIEIGTNIKLLAQVKVNKETAKGEQDNNIIKSEKTEQNNDIVKSEKRKQNNNVVESEKSEQNNIIAGNGIKNEFNNVTDNKTGDENRVVSDNSTNKQSSEFKEEIVREETKIIKVVQKIKDENVNKENDGNDNREDNESGNGENDNYEANKPNEGSKQEETSKKSSEENSEQEKVNKAERNFNNGSQANNVSNQKSNMSENVNLGTSNFNNENQAVYNGSNNNYLSNLVVEGLELNTLFNKENSTYFINTNNTKDIMIMATAEDSSAKIYITGNDNIKKGENKILISVTAENGDVRYYRIFVNCEEVANET